MAIFIKSYAFLYSQDLSNRKTQVIARMDKLEFLYSQDLSNRKTMQTKDILTDGFCTLRI